MSVVARAVGLVMFFASTVAPAPVEPPFWTGREDAASFTKAQDDRLARARTILDAMLRARGRRTVENTLRPFDSACFEIDGAEAHSSLVQNVHPDKAMREAAEKANQKGAAARTALMLDRRVYDALLQVSAEKADDATRHYLAKVLRDMRLAGVDKDEATRRHIAALQDEIVATGQEFGRNVREDRRTVAVRDVGELAGLPKDFLDRHRPDEHGLIHITVDSVDVFPVLTYARSDSLRRALFLEYHNRAYPKNLAVLDRLLAKRHELATRLGFSTWADYVTADKMVGSAAKASEFIDRVVAASGPRMKQEYEALLACKRREQPQASAVHAWEAPYWMEQVRQSDHQYDSQQVRAYFPMARVKQGLLDVTSRLFGVSFRRLAGASVWHPSVECWEILEGSQVVGRVYLDLHPRPDKYTHAAHFNIRTGVAGLHLPEAALVCNLPGGVAGEPGLMDFKEVSTLFHEFGHLLHTVFGGRQRWAGLAGATTEFDFVEAPSQLFEEWLWSPQVLATFARRHETGEPIPADLVQRMRRAGEFGKALHVRRQMALARTSLSYYDRPPAHVDTDALLREATESYVPYPRVEGTHFQCMFQHLDHYSAFYYTYMWSLVIAKDLFSQFDRQNLLDPAAARRYREAILAPGGSAPAATLIERFLGRPFDARAWQEWLNRD
jgi:thimet oligopeptidase